MNTYKYARVQFDAITNVELWCTDSHELDDLLGELKKILPRYHVKQKRQLPSGQTYYYWLNELSGKDIDVGWWFIKQFCERGWAPMGDGRFRKEG